MFLDELGGEEVSFDHFIRADHIEVNVVGGGHWGLALLGIIGNIDRKDLKG